MPRVQSPPARNRRGFTRSSGVSPRGHSLPTARRRRVKGGMFHVKRPREHQDPAQPPIAPPAPGSHCDYDRRSTNSARPGDPGASCHVYSLGRPTPTVTSSRSSEQSRSTAASPPSSSRTPAAGRRVFHVKHPAGHRTQRDSRRFAPPIRLPSRSLALARRQRAAGRDRCLMPRSRMAYADAQPAAAPRGRTAAATAREYHPSSRGSGLFRVKHLIRAAASPARTVVPESLRQHRTEPQIEPSCPTHAIVLRIATRATAADGAQAAIGSPMIFRATTDRGRRYISESCRPARSMVR